jgi:hypothetical protein
MTCDVEMKLMKLAHSLLLAQLKPRLGMRHLAMLVRTSVAISSQQAERSASLAIAPQEELTIENSMKFPLEQKSD